MVINIDRLSICLRLWNMFNGAACRDASLTGGAVLATSW
ncbi:hypothetical protein GBL_1898 [Geobacillus kaustophilus GBlys]|uniref:Uncharacterized protein n=1 Tax=Geobacillus kaustophilus GBlys TaxID=1337888 RepID=U2WSD4_GEOKU|nr:hypothetical protein GBL_1898 [Geobacillus kaustophilus GBlys]